MSPIRISPEIPIHVSSDLEELERTPPTREQRVIKAEVYVLPQGKPLDHIVRVDGFSDAPGGMLETERLTPGHTKYDTKYDITLTTSDDPELSGKLGVTAIKIDGVLYEATKVEG